MAWRRLWVTDMVDLFILDRSLGGSWPSPIEAVPTAGEQKREFLALAIPGACFASPHRQLDFFAGRTILDYPGEALVLLE